MRALCAEGPRYSHGLKPPFRERGGEERVFKEQHGLALHKCRHLRALPLAVAEVQELSPSRTAGLREVYATVRFVCGAARADWCSHSTERACLSKVASQSCLSKGTRRG